MLTRPILFRSTMSIRAEYIFVKKYAKELAKSVTSATRYIVKDTASQDRLLEISRAFLTATQGLRRC